MTRIKDALDAVAAAIIAQKDYLTDLDRQIADGDHGINMTRGFQAAMDAVEEMDDTTKPGPVLETIGKAFIHNVGGAAGPLYGTGFIKAAAVCDENTKLNVASFEKLLGAAIAGIEKRGHAKKGDKTMLDTLIPIHACFLPENAEGKTLFEVCRTLRMPRRKAWTTRRQLPRAAAARASSVSAASATRTRAP